MTIHRAFVAPQILQDAKLGQVLKLPSEVTHRLADVVRVKADEVVELFDGQGLIIRGVLESRKTGDFRVESVERHQKSGPKLILAQAMVSQNKLEAIVQDATELGTDAFVLFAATHSVVKITDRTAGQIQRLQRIATDAARQCERPDIPELLGPLSFVELLKKLEKANVYVGDARESTKLEEALKSADSSLDNVLIIGPEGGLSSSELTQLRNLGAKVVQYAPHVLRTETAGIVGLSIIQSHVR